MEKHNPDIEIKLLFEAILLKYGHDYRNYSSTYIKRRISAFLKLNHLSSVSELQHRILLEPDFFYSFIFDLSLTVTEMFRDADFFIAVRDKVIPRLKDFSTIKIWHAGCSTGEEAYSMAIILKEECLLDRSIIYATDMNPVALKKASEGIYPIDSIRNYSDNYHKAMGRASFSDYFRVKYGSAKIDKLFQKKCMFFRHNLVSDGAFGEMNLIICRNVLIYFNRKLQNTVQKLFFESLVPGGILCLGSKESIMFSNCKKEYTLLDKTNILAKHSKVSQHLEKAPLNNKHEMT